METFGEWLQQQRSLRRLTREEFAKRVGCSVSALRKIEYGERRPSAQLAELLASCLDVPPEGRSTFVRVARGELSVARLVPESRPVVTTNVSPPKTNLPIFPTPLIGCQRELEQLSQLLGDPKCHLLAWSVREGLARPAWRLKHRMVTAMNRYHPALTYNAPGHKLRLFTLWEAQFVTVKGIVFRFLNNKILSRACRLYNCTFW